jgi:malonyl-CoA O-methyltransferase
MKRRDQDRAAFDRLTADYDCHAALEQEVARRLTERTTFKRLQAERVLDLGCGTGDVAARLKKAFPKARVLGLDFSEQMLGRLKRRSRLMRPLFPVCADMAELPLAQASLDMVLSNLATTWVPEPARLFGEIRRVLRVDGLFLFSQFGPDSLEPLRSAWSRVDPGVNIPIFPDIMEVGDALAAAGFREPAMDRDLITMHYPSLQAMMAELEATGTALLVRGWRRWRDRVAELEEAFQPILENGKYPLRYEIVYGLAFGPAEGQPRRTEGGEIATVSVDSLLKPRPLAIVETGRKQFSYTTQV